MLVWLAPTLAATFFRGIAQRLVKKYIGIASILAGYEAYLGGIDYFLKFDYRAAERAFRSALELAPDFHMARYRLAHVQVANGDTEAALATLDRIPANAPLTRRERLYA
jgi:thioredoxin-like negative regulator of GroEL